MPDITPVRMSRVLNAGYGAMKTARRARVMYNIQMAGRFYSEVRNSAAGGGDDIKASPINLLHAAVTTIVPNLVFNNPRIKLRTDILDYREYMSVLELAVNQRIKLMNFRKALRLCIFDSIFMAGFMKTGLALSGEIIPADGFDYELDEPFAERVDPDDMILDPIARAWDEQNLMGNRYTANSEDAIARGFDKNLIETGVDRFKTNAGPETSRISKRGQDGYLFDSVDLVEVFVPREQLVYTALWQPGHEMSDFLDIREWGGPKSGPYHMLGYQQIPDNILPVPPASMWFDLHLLGNKLARQIARQSERAKRLTIYDGTAELDMDHIRTAPDGDTLKVSNVEGIKELNYGGTSDDAFQSLEWVKANFSEQAGQLDQLSGQKAAAPTLGQSEILQANSSVRLADLQNQVHDFVGDVGKDLAFYIHTDPAHELHLVRRERGVERQVIFTPEQAKGEILDYATEVVPFSMARQDPNMRIRRLMEFWSAVIPSIVQSQQILGPSFKGDKALQAAAEEMGIEDADAWLDIDEFKDIFMAQFLAQLEQGNASQFKTGTSPQGTLSLGPGAETGGRPDQPLPSANGPIGGTSPGQEQNAARQDTAGSTQALGGPI
jgi:hypothetical protein